MRNTNTTPPTGNTLQILNKYSKKAKDRDWSDYRR